MEYLGKKFLFKVVVETLNDLKLRNKAFINARKVRNIIERKFNYSISSNLLSRFISISLDWLVASEYLVLVKKTSPKKYRIPDQFLVNSKNIRIYF